MARNFPLDLLIAVDLALWIPFTPAGFDTPSKELTWLDVNPPYRFAKIVQASKRLGFRQREWPEVDLDEFISNRQQSLCDHLGWNTPTTLASQWLTHLESRSTKWFVDPLIGGFRYKAMLQLLKLRTASPGKVVVNGIDFQKLRVARNAGWITQEAKSLLLPFFLGEEEDREPTQFLFAINCLFPIVLGANCSRSQFVARFPDQVIDWMLNAFDDFGRATEGWPGSTFKDAVQRFIMTFKEEG